MKTILSRIGSVAAGKFLNEDLANEYEDITTYVNDVEKVLSKVGLRLRDTNHQFRDAQDILDDVAASWKNYSDLEKNAIETAFAGRQCLMPEHIVIYGLAVYKLSRMCSNR